MRPLRRVRGTLLRLVMDRRLAVGLGLALIVPGVWLWAVDYRWESWITDGCGLLGLATGAALVLAGLGGRRPDWIEDDDKGRENPSRDR